MVSPHGGNMDNNAILATLDYTLLKQFADNSAIDKLCEKALRYHTASVCIPPSYIKYVREKHPTLNICTVIGFPNGYSTTAVKVFETEEALRDGANEIDMVINITDVKNGLFDRVTEEIKAVRKACEGHILKVIIETCFLTEDEKIRLCQCVTEAKADFIKTSTGFGTAGATLEDVKLFRKHVGKDVRIKAAGGIRSLEAIKEYLEAGASRIGTSLDPEGLFKENR